MALTQLATEDMEIKFDNITPGGTVYGGDLGTDETTITVNPSPKVEVDDVAVCRVNVVALFTAAAPCPHTYAAHDFVAGGGAIVAPTTETKDDLLNVLREGDAGDCVGSFKMTAAPFTVVPCSCKMSIAKAGQDGEVNGN